METSVVVARAVRSTWPRARLGGSSLILLLLIVVAGCADRVSGPHQQTLSSNPPFQLAVTPATISGHPGTTTDTAMISIVSVGSFSGTVTVHVDGLPDGASTWPHLPISINTGVVLPIAITLPPSAVPDSSTIVIQGNSKNEPTQSTKLELKVLSPVTAYRDGRLLVLERVTDEDTIRLALDADWGGSLVEASIDGVNVVNSHDPGREVQIALYDRDQLSPLRWNPVQGGDSFGNGSPVLDQRIESGSLYVKTRPLHWYPDRMGGSGTRPVPSDVYVEQWVEPVPSQPRAFHFHYRITHFGSDYHTAARQEMPAVYTNREFSTLIVYDGDAPWTLGALSSPSLPSPDDPSRFFRTVEQWASFVNKNGVGLTIYSPDSYGYIEAASHLSGSAGSRGWAFNYLRPLTVFGLPAASTVESDLYLILGNYEAARATVYALRGDVSERAILAPYLTVDRPEVGQTVSGSAEIVGWSFARSPIARVSFSVDDGPWQPADYGRRRPDVAETFPGMSSDIGFRVLLDTRLYANGMHVLHVQSVDDNGAIATRDVEFVIRN